MRQHVNLSEYGYHILCMDYHACGLFENMSSFIGHIIKNYYQYPDLFIINSFEQEYMMLKSCFNRFDSDKEQALPSDSEYSFLHKIMLGYVEKKLDAIGREYASDKTLKVSLSDALADILFRQMEDEKKMFGPSSDFKLFPAPGYLKTKASYVKYLLEHYARLAPYDRQCILYKDSFDIINHIEESFYSSNNPGSVSIPLYELRRSGEETGFERIFVKPYRLTRKEESTSPELLCFSDQIKPGTRSHCFLPDSIPLSVIRSMKPAAKYLGSGKLTFRQQTELDSKAENGFFETEITISFSEDGFQEYLSDFSRKPDADPSAARITFDHRILLSFRGNLSYLYRYFAFYGEDAIIVSPDEKMRIMEDVCKCAYFTYEEQTTSAAEWSPDANLAASVMDIIRNIKEGKQNWMSAKDECRMRSQSEQDFGFYPYFIKTAAENGIAEAYADYADMLFDGIFVSRDYNLAGYYYTKSRSTLTLTQKYNLASIYENGLCKGHSIAEGKEILLNRNENKEPVFEYKSPEGYTFHALKCIAKSKNMPKKR